jgi:hypothetical protein
MAAPGRALQPAASLVSLHTTAYIHVMTGHWLLGAHLTNILLAVMPTQSLSEPAQHLYESAHYLHHLPEPNKASSPPHHVGWQPRGLPRWT